MSTINLDTNRATVRVGRELDALSAARMALYPTRPSTDADWAVRAVVLALNYAREAGWWSVLLMAGSELDVSRVYRTAVVVARADARDRARFWRESAAEWQARAEQRPTSDAAGSLSNWHELGVTA